MSFNFLLRWRASSSNFSFFLASFFAFLRSRSRWRLLSFLRTESSILRGWVIILAPPLIMLSATILIIPQCFEHSLFFETEVVFALKSIHLIKIFFISIDINLIAIIICLGLRFSRIHPTTVKDETKYTMSTHALSPWLHWYLLHQECIILVDLGLFLHVSPFLECLGGCFIILSCH